MDYQLKPFFIACCLCLPHFIYAQDLSGLDPDKALSQYILDVWRVSDGLPSGTVRDITQSDDGFLWIATSGGLARFDGNLFRHVTLPAFPEFGKASINALAFHPNQGLWVASNIGLFQYHQKTWRLVEGSQPFHFIQDMTFDGQESLWIAISVYGVRRFRGGKFEVFSHEQGLNNNMPNKVHWSPKTGVLAGTNGGLFKFEENHFTRQRINPVYALGSTQDGTIWVGDFLHGLIRRNPSGDETRFALEVGIQPSGLTHVIEDRRQSIWVGCNNEGLFRFAGNTWSRFREPDGLPDDRVFTMFEDRDGALWVGTQNGLARFRDDFMTVYTRREGMASDQQYCVVEDPEGVIWAGSSSGISGVSPNGQIQAITQFEDRQLGLVNGANVSPSGAVWFGTLGRGLVQINQGSLSQVKTDFNNPYIHGFFWQRNGDLWISPDSRALHRITAGKTQTFGKEQGWDSVFASYIYEDRAGELWASSVHGLFHFKDQRFHRIQEATSPDNERVRTIFEDNEGWLWFHVSGELTVYDRQTFTRIPLPEWGDAWQCSMIQDRLGFMWIGTHQGLYRIARTELLKRKADPQAQIKWRRFGLASGLKSVEFGKGQRGSILAKDGRLWFATAKGLMVLNPEKVPPPNPLPKPMIDQIAVNDTWQKDLSKFSLGPGQHRILASFTAVRFEEPESLQFRYRLEPYDDKWIPGDGTRQAIYTNLPPGDFNLLVSVRDGKNDWLNSDTSLSFEIKPFFYQTTWFIPSLILLGMLLTAALYAWRTRQLKAHNRKLEGLVETRTASLREQKERTQDLYSQLQTTHQAKLDELEEARALQLAMLPERPPQIPGWDIATMLQTASEVGGDYYDFEPEPGGGMTVALGDATGHGMKAGLFVAATKSHFQALAHEKDPITIARGISKNLKALKLKRMFMALSLGKIRQNRITLLLAGMPPAFWFHADTQQVETVVQKALPLGGFPNFPYRTDELELQPGDVLVLMSDGLPERFNPDNKMLTENRLAEVFQKAGYDTPEDILAKLFEAGETWSEGRPQDDDIAMVALKCILQKPS